MTNPETIGPYQIIRPLAEGGMGRVYLAKKTGEGGFEMTCVVKTIRDAHAGEEHFVRMFLREARILASLRHQNIVQVLDFGRFDGGLFLAMEYVEGRDLREVLRQAQAQGGPLPLPVALRIAVEALRGLDYAHRRRGPDGQPLGIVHRDLAPTNILLSREGEVKLVDFGIAKDAASDGFTEAGVIKGKWHYLAPEQLEGRPLDARADVYAMGVVLYDMATGRKPFEAETTAALLAKILSGEFPPASAIAGTPAALDRALARALARTPERRFESASAMIAELEKLAIELGPLPSAGLRDFYQKLFESPAGATAPVDDVFHEGATLTTASVPPSAAPMPAPRRTIRRTRVWAAGLIAAVLIFGGIWALAFGGLSKRTGAAPAPNLPSPVASPDAAPPEPAPPRPAIVEVAAPAKPANGAEKIEKTPTRIAEPPPAPISPTITAAAPAPPPASPAPPAPPALPARLSVSTQPHTQVTINGAALGWTPLADAVIKVGPNEIVLVNEEYGIKYTGTIEGVGGTTKKLPLEFKGTLKVDACADCAISVDGQKRGSGAIVIKLIAGTHAVTAEQNGQAVKSTVVTIKNDQVSEVNW